MTSPNEHAPVALVTGAKQGIGLETARRLTAAGCTVYVGARNPDRGAAAAAQIGARFVRLDVTSDESVVAAAAEPPTSFPPNGGNGVGVSRLLTGVSQRVSPAPAAVTL